MSNQAIIDHLNEILKWEWKGVRQYSQMAFIVKGLWRETYGEMFLDSAKESFKHAEIIGQKIAAMGGVPTVERADVEQAHDIETMLEIGLAFEANAVKLYGQAIEMADGHEYIALRSMLEDIIIEEQDGVDHLSKILEKHAYAGAEFDSTSEKAG
ncbi:Ferritin [Planctomycetales bacterium 10988]|nr:Ferritin [Planctomycetales bacterium 10988]